jgi:hypothetical protein
MASKETQPSNLHFRGADRNPEQRPGVPREAAPHPLPGTHWIEPERQPTEGVAILPGQRDRSTPVFSTALPPRGLSGALRIAAHRIPDYRVRHWVLLLVADRIDLIQNLRIGASRAAAC